MVLRPGVSKMTVVLHCYQCVNVVCDYVGKGVPQYVSKVTPDFTKVFEEKERREKKKNEHLTTGSSFC